jgi:shikimate dehydrogenase
MDSSTRTYCILGEPVSHSLSPVIQNAAFRALNLNSVYTAFEVAPKDLKSAVEGIRALGVSGASVTIPHKEKIIRHLDHLTDIAKKIGSVNTIFLKNGKLVGTNTDAPGFYQALSHTVSVEEKNIALFGSGGAARAVLFGLFYYGKPGSVSLVARNLKKAGELRWHLVRSLGAAGLHVQVMTREEWLEQKEDTDIIINTTSVGMTDARASILSKKEMPEGITVMDIVYRPHRTLLLRNALSRNCRVVYGIEMLLRQGAEQFALWTGKKAPLEVMRKALKKEISII